MVSKPPSTEHSTKPVNTTGGSGRSRIPNFFRLSVPERLIALNERGLLSDADLAALTSGDLMLDLATADRMIENVVGVLGLPLGLGLNFLINGKDYVVPLSVEEPSIIAGLSAAARVARLSGGFKASLPDTILIGQVQIVDIENPISAMQALQGHREEILSLANSLHPKMVARGGGAIGIELFHHKGPEDGRDMVVLHLLVDTKDAMGANLVNTMCEGIASLVESITQGQVFLRILSNLTDRALVRAEVTIPVNNLDGKDFSGTDVRDGIILACDLARVDPYRAATHNKGIMNGVDAIALATGNDWRAIEAAAHAWAASSGRYTSLTRWSRNAKGDLVGHIEIPMKVGTVGGSLQTNPSVRLSHRLLGNPGAQELSSVIAAVGLAQNFAALRALSTDGIQQGHMTLHARSVATSAGVPEALFDRVVDRLIESGEIKVWKAREIVGELEHPSTPVTEIVDTEPRSHAFGKVILLGEHAVVYGRHALAVPIPLAVEARVKDAREGVHLLIPRWGLEQRARPLEEHPQGVTGILAMLLNTLELADRSMEIEIFPHIPRAMGLGGSSALAVALIRALDVHFGLQLDNVTVNDLAYECEKAAHGTPSGVDNTIATYGGTLMFQNPGKPVFTELSAGCSMTLVIGMSGKESLTADMVARVASARTRQPRHYETLFDQIDQLTLAGAAAFKEGRLEELGELMNLCHGLLNALQLSTPELEDMVHISRQQGALGAKLTGGGGGGSMVALCGDSGNAVEQAIKLAGYDTLSVEIGS